MRWAHNRDLRLTLLALTAGIALAASAPSIASGQGVRLTRQRVETILAEKHSFFRVDMHGLNLSGLDFREVDLTEANLRGANLTGVRFDNAILVKANLSEAQLSGATFSGAQLDGANFARVSAGRIDLSGVRMRNAILDGADLQGARLDGANLLGASIISTNLRRANLARTLLDETRLIRTDLREANLTGASLRRARIVGVDVAGADVRGAILVGAEIDASANLDAAQNHASVVYDEPIAPRNVPNVRPPAAPWTARISLHQGVTVEVESWPEQDTLVFYVKDGVIHGIPPVKSRRSWTGPARFFATPRWYLRVVAGPWWAMLRQR